MASTTKIMTALVALERAKLTDSVVVPRPRRPTGGSTSGLVAGETLTVRTLLTGLLVASGNDAAIALAAHVGRGSQAAFVAVMNPSAQRARPHRTPATPTRTASTHPGTTRACATW